jgi:hypothetical protein
MYEEGWGWGVEMRKGETGREGGGGHLRHAPSEWIHLCFVRDLVGYIEIERKWCPGLDWKEVLFCSFLGLGLLLLIRRAHEFLLSKDQTTVCEDGEMKRRVPQIGSRDR